MHPGLFLYILVGLVAVYAESRCFNDLNFEEYSKGEIFLTIAQQSVHYLRVGAVWPLYMIEDMLIWIDSTLYPGDEDDEVPKN